MEEDERGEEEVLDWGSLLTWTAVLGASSAVLGASSAAEGSYSTSHSAAAFAACVVAAEEA